MKLENVIGRSIKEIWVCSQFNIDGFDKAQVGIKLDNERVIAFPWDLSDDNIERTVPSGAQDVLRNRGLKRIRNQVIIDVIAHREECGQTGYFELANGMIIYESTMFPSGAMNVGLLTYDSINDFEAEEGTDYVRLKKSLTTVADAHPSLNQNIDFK